MANYICATRSNYFHVKDPDSFREIFPHVRGDEDRVDLWEEKDDNGNPVFGFGCYGGILGYVEGDEDDEDIEADDAYDDFIKKLQQSVTEDDAIIIMESGAEKLRYVTGYTTVITWNAIVCKDMGGVAIREAQRLLDNKDWRTQVDY